jgi:TolA-binding protein
MGNGQEGSNSLTATELDVIASAIVTFGDALGTIAAVRALEAEVQEEKVQENQNKQMIRMQKQIDQLTRKLEKMEQLFKSYGGLD